MRSGTFYESLISRPSLNYYALGLGLGSLDKSKQSSYWPDLMIFLYCLLAVSLSH